MRFDRWELSDLCKTGLSPTDLEGNTLGLSALKNLKTDGNYLSGCPVETVTKIDAALACFSLTLGDYYVLVDGIYKVGTGKIYSATWTGAIKIVNLVAVAWVQDSVKTIFVDSQGVFPNNPTGREVPVVNSIATLNGQIIFGGIVSSKVVGHLGLGQSYIGYSAIGSDEFELTKQNEAGTMHPDLGTIYGVCPMMESILVLGNLGGVLLYYVNHIFGRRQLAIPTPKSLGLCAYSPASSVYISKKNDIVLVSSEGKYNNLGYEWIGKLTTSIFYSRILNAFVFTTATTSYVLDEFGMYSFGHKIFGEISTGLVVPTTWEQASWSFTTTFWDNDKAGLKNLQEVYVRDGLNGVGGSVEMFSETSASSGGVKVLNKLSATKYSLSGSQLALKYTSTAAPTVSKIQYQTITLDRRFGHGYLQKGGA